MSDERRIGGPLGGWQIIGTGTPLSWQWSASGPLGSESGSAPSQDEARLLAQEAHARLDPGRREL